jgi:hypothetical protein
MDHDLVNTCGQWRSAWDRQHLTYVPRNGFLRRSLQRNRTHLEVIKGEKLMKHASWIACCTLCAGFGMGTAAAQPISVKITGHIVQLQDDTGLLSPYLPPTTPITTTYTYDPSAPIIQTGYGQYTLPSSSASIVVNTGPFTFQTGQATRLQALVNPGTPGSASGSFSLQGYQNPPLANGLQVAFIGISLMDPTGQWPTSTALPVGAPGMTNFVYSQVIISGGGTGTSYQITTEIDSVELLPPAIEVSPATGSFVPQQHFDAAILLPIGSAPVANMTASIAGVPLTFNYPGTCQLGAPTSSGRSALVCPGADSALLSFQGITQIDWQVTLTDGSSFTQSVQWNLIR